MANTVLVALIATATSIVVAGITPWIARRLDLGKERRVSATEVNLRYLTPLRHQVVEAAFRNRQIASMARAGDLESFGSLADIEELQRKDLRWFTGLGCQLMSTAYIAACLFAELSRLRDAYPFLRLNSKGRDTELAEQVLQVNIAFLRNHGVYYALQYTIGRDMIGQDGHIASYAEFCERVRDPTSGVWYERLIELYRVAATDNSGTRFDEVVSALSRLSTLLDAAVDGSPSLSDRFRAETANQLSGHDSRSDELPT
jgi:hypothetical protein